MFHPGADAMIPPPSSPTVSSVSSSDLDTESTGSFFHDRSTSLGTLMGVNFPTITFRTPSQSQARVACASDTGFAADGGRKKRRNWGLALTAEKRRRWWSLCRDDEDAKPGSLGEFLKVERRFGEGAFEAELEGVMGPISSGENGTRVLFADGRVLPPVAQSPSTATVLWRFPISGICSGGA